MNSLNKQNYDEYINSLKRNGPAYHSPYLNCLRYGYLSWRVSTIPYNIRQFFRNLRYAWQRAVNGYCAQDWWNMDHYIMTLIPDMLEQMAAKGISYPGRAPYKEPEEWQEALLYTAYQFRAALDEDCDWIDNPYYDEYMESLRNGDILGNDSPRDEIVAHRYFEEERNRDRIREDLRNDAWYWIASNIRDLWD